ncbi:hypothetical protein JKP88DRAFT_293420 [Tribonema minus]|uniref:Uncharacterized protein n=1 Tax=Tribonema minus TaxID=303371 RepID=A0A835ZDG8_9STRA|nr:hypothetical protein JKP88DRAFT_293420 [Tribonema minus]
MLAILQLALVQALEDKGDVAGALTQGAAVAAPCGEAVKAAEGKVAAAAAGDADKLLEQLQSEAATSTSTPTAAPLLAAQLACAGATATGDAATAAALNKALARLDMTPPLPHVEQQQLLAATARAALRSGHPQVAAACLKRAHTVRAPSAAVGEAAVTAADGAAAARIGLAFARAELAVTPGGGEGGGAVQKQSEAEALAARVEALSVVESALQACLRTATGRTGAELACLRTVQGRAGAELVRDGSALCLHIAQPLLRARLRQHALAALSTAASALQAAGGGHRDGALRARLLLEAARCHAEAGRAFEARAAAEQASYSDSELEVARCHAEAGRAFEVRVAAEQVGSAFEVRVLQRNSAGGGELTEPSNGGVWADRAARLLDRCSDKVEVEAALALYQATASAVPKPPKPSLTETTLLQEQLPKELLSAAASYLDALPSTDAADASTAQQLQQRAFVASLWVELAVKAGDSGAAPLSLRAALESLSTGSATPAVKEKSMRAVEVGSALALAALSTSTAAELSKDATSSTQTVSHALAERYEGCGDLKLAEAAAAALLLALASGSAAAQESTDALLRGGAAAVTADAPSDPLKALALLAGSIEHPLADKAECAAALSKVLALMRGHHSPSVVGGAEGQEAGAKSGAGSSSGSGGSNELVARVWYRTARAAAALDAHHDAQECCERALSLLPASATSTLTSTSTSTLRAATECTWGGALATMALPLSAALELQLQRTALAHYAAAVAAAAAAGAAALRARALTEAWNGCALRMAATAEGRRALTRDLGALLAADAPRQAIEQARLKLWQLCLQCHADNEDWQGGYKAVTAAVGALPARLHGQLLHWRSLFEERLGLCQPALDPDLPSTATPQERADAHAAAARRLQAPDELRDAYQRAIDAVGGESASVRVVFLLEGGGGAEEGGYVVAVGAVRALGVLVTLSQDVQERRSLLLRAHRHVRSAVHTMLSTADPPAPTPTSPAEWVQWSLPKPAVTPAETAAKTAAAPAAAALLHHALRLADQTRAAGLEVHALAPLAWAQLMGAGGGYAGETADAVRAQAALACARRAELLLTLGHGAAAEAALAQLPLPPDAGSGGGGSGASPDPSPANETPESESSQQSFLQTTQTRRRRSQRQSIAPPEQQQQARKSSEAGRAWARTAAALVRIGQFPVAERCLAAAARACGGARDAGGAALCAAAQAAVLSRGRGDRAAAARCLEAAAATAAAERSGGGGGGGGVCEWSGIVRQLAAEYAALGRGGAAAAALAAACEALQSCCGGGGGDGSSSSGGGSGGVNVGTVEAVMARAECALQLACCHADGTGSASSAGVVALLREIETELVAYGGAEHALHAAVLRQLGLLAAAGAQTDVKCLEQAALDLASAAAVAVQAAAAAAADVSDTTLSTLPSDDASSAPLLSADAAGGAVLSTPQARLAGALQLDVTRVHLRLAIARGEDTCSQEPDAKASTHGRTGVDPVTLWLEASASGSYGKPRQFHLDAALVHSRNAIKPEAPPPVAVPAKGKGRKASVPDPAPEPVPLPEFGPHTLLEAAKETLQQEAAKETLKQLALAAAANERAWGVTATAGLALCEATGWSNHLEAALSLFQAQSCRASLWLKSLVAAALAPDSVHRLHLDKLADPAAFPGALLRYAPAAASARHLALHYAPWRRLDCSSPPSDCLQRLPSNTIALSIALSEDSRAVVAAAATTATPPPTGGKNASTPVPVTRGAVSRLPLDRRARARLAALVSAAACSSSGGGGGGGGGGGSGGGGASGGGGGGGGGVALQTDVVAEMTELLGLLLEAPPVAELLSTAATAAAASAQPVTVLLLPDLSLSALPWELLPAIAAMSTAATTTRDFSLHVYAHRIAAAAADAATVVDPASILLLSDVGSVDAGDGAAALNSCKGSEAWQRRALPVGPAAVPPLALYDCTDALRRCAAAAATSAGASRCYGAMLYCGGSGGADCLTKLGASTVVALNMEGCAAVVVADAGACAPPLLPPARPGRALEAAALWSLSGASAVVVYTHGCNDAEECQSEQRLRRVYTAWSLDHGATIASAAAAEASNGAVLYGVPNIKLKA